MKRVMLMVSLSLFPRLLVAHAVDLQSLEGETWYGLYMKGAKSGYAVETLDIADDGSVMMSEDAHFRIRMVDVKQDMRVYTKRLYGADGALREIESRVDQISASEVFSAKIEGDQMHVTNTVGGDVTEKTLPRPSESLDDALRQITLVGRDAQVGDEVTYTLFEPMMEKENNCVSRIVGVEERLLDGAPTKVFRVKTTGDAIKLETITYITERGVKLEDVVAGTIKMRLEPKEIAQDVDYSNDVIVSNAAELDGPIVEPRTRAAIRLKVTGPLTVDHLFNDERQFLAAQGDAFVFVGKRLSLDGFDTAKLPITNPDAAPWLEATQFVQSDNPKLIEKAKEIVGDETDAFAVSTKLCHWVYQNVRTTYSARLSNALEVLGSLEGDCTEHSILFVGLARAAGLPAREVAGLIYWEKEGYHAFLFHQWAKVWVGKWIDVDPTFNQPLVDVTHIKLAEGDLFEQVHLIPIIGQISVAVIEPDSQAAAGG